jgi:pimeloyl-ACP methyl ester carboxylesterase
MNDYSTGIVASQDGTRIGYRRIGRGPAVVLVQGAMGTAHNFDELARALADDFTVFVPDRRGRGMSPRPYTPGHSIQRDVEDLDSVRSIADAHFVFGLSSGAVITLEAARTLPAIHKAALYEPPFHPDISTELIARFQEQIGRGRLAAAFVTAMRIVNLGPRALRSIPRPLFELAAGALLLLERLKGSGEYAALRELLPAMRFDFHVVAGMRRAAESFAAVPGEVLLLGGSESPAYLKDALSTLARVLPRARRTELAGLDHAAPWNRDRGGSPTLVAQAVRGFLRAG